MKSAIVAAVVGLLLLCSLGCGAVFIGGAINTGTTIRGSVTGITVSNVMNGTGGTTQVTFVTFFQNSASTTVGFCGDQATQFPMNQPVSVNFNSGQVCAVVLAVIIL